MSNRFLTQTEAACLVALAGTDHDLIAAVERVTEPESCRAPTRPIRYDDIAEIPAEFACEDPTVPVPAETMADLVFRGRVRTEDIAL